MLKKKGGEKPRAVHRKSTNLGQPDIGGHDLLPLMLQERRDTSEKGPGLMSPPAPPQSLGTPEE